MSHPENSTTTTTSRVKGNSGDSKIVIKDETNTTTQKLSRKEWADLNEYNKGIEAIISCIKEVNDSMGGVFLKYKGNLTELIKDFCSRHEALNEADDTYKKNIDQLNFKVNYLHVFKNSGEDLDKKIKDFYKPSTNKNVSEEQAREAFKEAIKKAVLYLVIENIHDENLFVIPDIHDQVEKFANSSQINQNSQQNPSTPVFAVQNPENAKKETAADINSPSKNSSPIAQGTPGASSTDLTNNPRDSIESPPPSAIPASPNRSSGLYKAFEAILQLVLRVLRFFGRGPRQSTPDSSASPALPNHSLKNAKYEKNWSSSPPLSRTSSLPANNSVAPSKPPQRRVKFALPLPRWTTVPDLTASGEVEDSSMQIGNP